MNTDTGKLARLILAVAIFLSGLVGAGEINTGYFGNVAIKGYDSVAYFTKHRAIKGSEDFSYDWLGARWIFSSEEHKVMFAENPVNYAHNMAAMALTVSRTAILPEISIRRPGVLSRVSYI